MPSKKRQPIPIKINQSPKSNKRPPLSINLPPARQTLTNKRPPLPITLPASTIPPKKTPATGQWLRRHSPVYLSLLDTLP